jgi:hypothetical protein
MFIGAFSSKAGAKVRQGFGLYKKKSRKFIGLKELRIQRYCESESLNP